ncbi:TRAP transporter substrate-binding protein [Litoreibacter roseus]|uniref:C4-dicarboxylate ABC transporter n=1 Tax=Litoreibacter roseus TaxID=2601869 RepID=A0A6N6JKH3_9RHOB|nr:TRAP transporter substrate-binding protein [Litoreibacter roseus]GFE66360.1 C4-dicarboxylate ABC transporter [Litoreibacter roseus]
MSNNTSQKITTRRGLLGAGLAGMAGGLAAPLVAQTGGARTIRMATSWPKDLGGLADSAARVAQTITQMSEGSLSVEVYGPGELVGALEVHDAAGNGDIEMYHSAEYYFQRKHRGLNFFTTVPLGLTMLEQASWLTYGGGQALWDEVNAQFGVKSLPVGGTGVQMGGWFDKPIESVDDFNGLTMRMPGLGGQVISELGAEAVVLSGGGIVKALFEQSINATEWVGPYNDLHFGFQKILSTYVYPGFHEPGTMAALGMNKAFWDGLSSREQSIIQTATDVELSLHSADYYGNNGLALTQMINEYGVQPTLLPDDVWDAIAKKSMEVVSGVANDDDLARRIFESFDAHRSLMFGGAPFDQAEYLARRFGSTPLWSNYSFEHLEL